MSELETMREEQTDAKPSFIVDDDTKAEWCIRKIREKAQELAKWKAHYEALYEAVEKQINEDVEYFNYQLEQYLRRQQDAGFTKKAKTQVSYSLPSGKLVLKKQEPEYEKDNGKLIPWLKTNDPNYVKIKEDVDWAGLKKKLIYVDGHMATEDGEIVPGITAVKRPDKFAVEVK